jgi:class 3 adenylate cyclase
MSKLAAYRTEAAFYRALSLAARLLTLLGLCLAAVFLVPFAVPHIKDALSFRYIAQAVSLQESISAFLHSHIPTVIGGRDLTLWIVFGGAFIIMLTGRRLRRNFSSRRDRLLPKIQFETFKATQNLSDNAKVLRPLKDQLEDIEMAASGKEREKLLTLFAQTKKKLDAMGKDLAFLAIDVVDSTGMKQGEEKAIIENDFREYKKFVESKIGAQGAMKSAWTPDGAMICFPTINAAVQAARDIINGLGTFNSSVKTIRADFAVRCGVNFGYVYFDDSMPMEEMSDRVIDIAGHMQKYAAPNTICVAKQAIEPVDEREGFISASKVVDGYEVYMWGGGEE